MIASQKIGKSFAGALRYNMQKMASPRAELRAELLASTFSSLDMREIKREVEWVRQLRPNLNRYVYHTSLNFSSEEAALLTNEKLLAIARDYLQALGYTNNQHMIFRHHDAGHPHVHLLANRIRYDGSVVSDSNNYKKSEALLRRLEKQYGLKAVEQSRYRAIETSSPMVIKKQGYVDTGLYSPMATGQQLNIAVEPSSYIAIKAPTNDELEMVRRTGKASGRMVLQSLLDSLLSEPHDTLAGFISAGEEKGLRFLFNQSGTTGRISGITYFYGDFKITGKALGARYKWGEISKHIGYEQIRDGQAAGQANDTTKGIYGDTGQREGSAAKAERGGPGVPGQDARADAGNGTHDLPVPSAGGTDAAGAGSADQATRDADQWAAQSAAAGGKDAPGLDSGYRHRADFDTGSFAIEIADDEDDAWRRRKARSRSR
jgi:hypothetical protein